MIEEAVCAALKGITTVEDLSRLEPLAAAGTFPRPIRGGCNDRAAWLEFDPDWQPPGERPRMCRRIRQSNWYGVRCGVFSGFYSAVVIIAIRTRF
jgi:hypothetical protein